MMSSLLIILRYLLCLLGAAGLLFTFSYPDSIIPPDPLYENSTAFSLYALKPLLWVIPVLFIELVSILGPRRNLVWFSALLTVLVLALLAYPLLTAYRPEYVEPTFSYQGNMLSSGLVYYVIFIGISLALRLVLLAYMFPPEELQDQLEIGFVSASELNPDSARTVKEIAALEKPKAHQFRFQQADNRLVQRFKLLMNRMLLRSKIRAICTGCAVLLLVLWFTCYPRPSAEEALQRDLNTMLQYRVTANGYPLATTAAVHAAARVMKHISDTECLGGMNFEQAEAWLGLDRVPEAQRTWLRDDRPIDMASTNSMYESRTRFLTITDGRHICVLYVRPHAEDGTIVVSELQEAGWDAVADETRRLIGNDWGALYR